MIWACTDALVLDLLALGRVFLFRVAYQSHFSAELVPYRVVKAEAQSVPPLRTVYNPVLGRSLCEMLERVMRACGRGDWAEAEFWCRAAGSVKELPAVYRGSINVELADAVARYYMGVVMLGTGDIDQSIQILANCGEQLAFTLPDLSAPCWLGLARVYAFQRDPANALWALEKSSGLSKDCRRSTNEVLGPLLEAEYRRIKVL